MPNTAAFFNPTGQAAPSGLRGGLEHFGSIEGFRAANHGPLRVRPQIVSPRSASLRSAAPLPKNTEELIDDAVVRIGRQRLTIVDDLISAGLTVPLPNWLGVPTITHHELSEAGEAMRSMVPKARGRRQIADLDTVTTPIFCTWDDFSFSVRELEAAARVGYPLDVSHAEQATRNVNVGLEDAAINGLTATFNGHAVNGLLDSTNTNAYIDNEAWTHANHSGQDILDDVLDMADVLRTDKFYGPYTLYVNTTYDNELNKNFGDGVTTFPITTRQRLEQLEFGGENLRVRAADLLPADRTALVQMTSDVIDLVVGQQPTMVSWTDGPGWERYFVILACVVPRLKINYDGNYGVCAGDTS